MTGASSSKSRQQALRDRRRAAGIRQYAFWLTAAEADRVRQFIVGLMKRRAAK